MRVPSALCGVVGLRPTVGRTSTTHCPENAFSIMSFGAHTASIADATLVYAVIANAGARTLSQWCSSHTLDVFCTVLLTRMTTLGAGDDELFSPLHYSFRPTLPQCDAAFTWKCRPCGDGSVEFFMIMHLKVLRCYLHL